MLAKCSHTVAAFALLLLASCAQQPLSSIDRTKYKTVALDSDIKAPDHYVYRDITGKRWRGFAGGLVGLMAGAASEGAGFHRFDAAAKKNLVDIRSVVRRTNENTLQSLYLLKIV